MTKNEVPTAKGKKSKYAQKLKRKFGSGSVDPRWMWWLERSAAVAGVALALLLPSVALAETKAAKPKTCSVFTEATLTSGAKVGVCAPTKEGGKPAYLRSYQIVSVLNPSTGKVERLMLGFQ